MCRGEGTPKSRSHCIYTELCAVYRALGKSVVQNLDRTDLPNTSIKKVQLKEKTVFLKSKFFELKMLFPDVWS